MTSFDTLVISLRNTPFQEADQVVSYYSAEHGELRAIAKGVKKPSSKLAGACEPLTLNHVYFARGKTLHTVCHYDRVESFAVMRLDLERLSVGAVCTDLIRLLGRENDPESRTVYALLASTLHALNNPEISWEESSLFFHLHMLKLAGYLPPFTHCIACEKGLEMEETAFYPFFPGLGGFVCRDCFHHVNDSRWVNTSTTTLKLFNAPMNHELYGNAVKAHRFLAYYWNQKLEQPLKSFNFLFNLLGGTALAPQDNHASILGE